MREGDNDGVADDGDDDTCHAEHFLCHFRGYSISSLNFVMTPWYEALWPLLYRQGK